MKPFLCMLSFHHIVDLTGECGYKIWDADNTEQGGWDDTLYIHVSRCLKCGEIYAWVSDKYFRSMVGDGDIHRDATQDEKLQYLEHYFTTLNPGYRKPTTGELLEFMDPGKYKR